MVASWISVFVKCGHAASRSFDVTEHLDNSWQSNELEMCKSDDFLRLIVELRSTWQRNLGQSDCCRHTKHNNLENDHDDFLVKKLSHFCQLLKQNF